MLLQISPRQSTKAYCISSIIKHDPLQSQPPTPVRLTMPPDLRTLTKQSQIRDITNIDVALYLTTRKGETDEQAQRHPQLRATIHPPCMCISWIPQCHSSWKHTQGGFSLGKSIEAGHGTSAQKGTHYAPTYLPPAPCVQRRETPSSKHKEAHTSRRRPLNLTQPRYCTTNITRPTRSNRPLFALYTATAIVDKRFFDAWRHKKERGKAGGTRERTKNKKTR